MRARMDIQRRARVFWRFLYRKLFLINDTPHKIALGCALGVFAGMLPGAGPVAAVFLALMLRANRASALLLGILTNTWSSIVTFVGALHVGAAVFGIEWQSLSAQWISVREHFSLKAVTGSAFLNIILPVVAGYAIIAVALGCVVYAAVLIIIAARQGGQKKEREGNNG